MCWLIKCQAVKSQDLICSVAYKSGWLCRPAVQQLLRLQSARKEAGGISQAQGWVNFHFVKPSPLNKLDLSFHYGDTVYYIRPSYLRKHNMHRIGILTGKTLCRKCRLKEETAKYLNAWIRKGQRPLGLWQRDR